MKPSPSYAVPLNRRHDRDEVYTAALQYRRSAYKFVLGRISKKTLFFIISCISIRWSTAWPYHSSINNESERFIDRHAINMPPECTCSQFVGIWNLSPTTFFFAKPDLKDCSLQSFFWNLKFVTKSILLGKLLTKELFLQSTGVHKAISRKSEICHLLLFLSVLYSETILHNKFIGGCFVSGRNNPEYRCKYIPIIV